MDDIRGMIDRLADLSEDELSELESSIIAAFEVVEGQDISRESVAEMTFLADSVENVRAEMGRRDAEKVELAAEAAEAATRIQSVEAQPAEAAVEDTTEPPSTFATEEPVTASTEAAVDEAVEAAVEEPVTASTEAVVEEAVEASVEEAVEAAVEEAVEAAVEETVEAAVEAPAAAEAAIEVPEAAEAAVEEEAVEAEPAAELGMAMPDEEEGEVVEEMIEEVEEAPVEIAPAPEDEEDKPVFSNDETTATSTEAQMSNETSEPTFSAPADRLPVARESAAAQIALVAGGDIPGVSAGAPLKDRLALAEAMSMRLHSLRRASGGNGEQVVVASLLATFPEERTLRGNEVDTNSEKLKAVVDPNVIVASGGWCAPLPVNYDLFEIGGSTATPVKDSMPTFNADRGGVRYVQTPVFGDYAGAIGIWTNQDDIDAATDPDKKKVCLTVGCAAEEEVYLEAVTMCLCFGNMQTRAFPELIARHNDLALVAAARFAEQYVLDRIKALSTAVALPAVLGTARDVLIAVERAAAAYRHQYRLDPNLPLRFIAPQWLHGMIRSDLTAQLPGDGLDTTFTLADATIERFFTARNIRPTWSMDGVTGAAEPTVTDFPDTVEWALFAEGTFTLLDGGTLDIGIVRDMSLVQKNDYCMFTEEFLNVAKMGLDALWVTQSLNVNGGSAGTLDVSAVDY